MVLVEFTPNLEKHLRCPTLQVEGSNLRDILLQCCRLNPPLRSYLLDDQNCVRKHIAIFIDGVIFSDRERQSDAVKADSRVFVAQALSGG